MKFRRKSRAITVVQICKKMTCNDPKLDLAKMNADINFVKFYLLVLKILSGNEIMIDRRTN